MTSTFKEWFAKIQEDTNIINTVTEIHKAHYPFIEEGYSDLLEDSDWHPL